ncbi:MAG TPA: hypothetical protein VFA29_01845 [Candidatus Baltobacteraceae bacterium]|nr:hypothetical protein [Candidatus Baltobacteraceae bacterium]
MIGKFGVDMGRTVLKPCVVALIALLAGCARPGALYAPSLAAPNLEHHAPSATGIPALVLSEPTTLLLFDSGLNQIGQIHTASVQGGAIALDREGDIYFAGYDEYAERLFIYPPPYTSSQKITFKGYVRGVAVDWRNDVFAFATDPLAPNDHGGIYFFRHGDLKPCATVGLPTGVYTDTVSVNFDGEGTFFTALQNGGSGGIITSVSGECNAKTFVTYSPAVPNVNHLQFNSSDQLVIEESDLSNDAPIVTFPHPSNGRVGKPLFKTNLHFLNKRPPVMLTFNSDGSALWAANVFIGGAVGLYNYPAGGTPTKILNLQRIDGGAVFPPLKP